MNSLTPVTSLARSSAEMVAAAEESGADLADARLATETVARRAEGILHFVESYREFAQSPDIHRRTFLAHPWAEEVLRLATTNAAGRQIDAGLEIRPETLSLSADPELLAQAVLNLLRNSIRVTAEQESPQIRLIVARAKSTVRASMRRNGITELLGEDNLVPTVFDALDAIEPGVTTPA